MAEHSALARLRKPWDNKELYHHTPTSDWV